MKHLDLLYKYRPCDPSQPNVCERTLQMLREGTTWISTPASFNDPFDCKPSILRNLEIEEKNLKKILHNRLLVVKRALRNGQELADRHVHPIPRRTLVELRRLLQSQRPDRLKYEAVRRYFAEPPTANAAMRELEALLARVGVWSASSTPTQMLMWAHYASQHSGFCLGFERPGRSLLADPDHTKPVKYLDDYPSIDLSGLGLDWEVSIGDGRVSDSLGIALQEPHLQAVIYSKSSDWKYEQEWRVLTAEGGKGVPYPGPLRRVIFGLRCAKTSREAIQAAVNEYSSEALIQFSQIRSQPGTFALRVREISSALLHSRRSARIL